jgi:plastocyanin
MYARLCALGVLGAAASAATASASETIRISIEKLAFTPAQVSAHVGDTIEWTNNDFVAHTATARNKDWDVAIPAKGVARVTISRAGDVDYYCRFHPNMTGRMSVAP